MPETSLVLASRSTYRRMLLERLVADFECLPADIDETPLTSETPAALAARLALGKAAAIASERPTSIIIGSDQVAALDSRVFGKPGNKEKAAQQLQACSGLTVEFFTAVTVQSITTGYSDSHTDLTRVQFRHLTDAEIDTYLMRDEPWDCAGSFRSEGLGAALFESIKNEDPSAIIGLPLIWLASSLRRAGVPIL